MKIQLRSILLILLITGLIIPSLYIAAPTVRKRIPTNAPSAPRYSEAKNVTISPSEIQIILGTLGQIVNPKDLDKLSNELKGTTEFSKLKEDPIAEYIATLSALSQNMIRIEDGLQEARRDLASGNMRQSAMEIAELNTLRNETMPLLSSLYDLLARLNVKYGIDTSIQLEKVKELDQRFQGYSVQISELGAGLIPQQQGRVQTMLILNASKQHVLVGESFFVYGILKDQNGTGLAFRNIAVSWGSNNTISRITDFEGRFNASLLLPFGYPAGPIQIWVTFEPEQADRDVYSPSRSSVVVRIEYLPTTIKADITPNIGKPLDIVYIKGNLSTPTGNLVENRTVTFSLDEALLGSNKTDNKGNFLFHFVVSQSLNPGNHSVTVSFTPVAAPLAASNAALPFLIELFRTQIQIKTDSSWLLSGTSVTVHANVTDADGAAVNSGSIAIYVDNIRFAHGLVDLNGSFITAITIPVTYSFGNHIIRGEYEPDLPWLQSSNSTTRIFVYNTPLTILAAIVIPTALSIGAYVARNRRRRPVLTTVSLPQPELVTQVAMRKLTPGELTRTIQAETDNAMKVRRAYNLAQDLITQKTGDKPKESETPGEYLHRVTQSVPRITPTLKRLIELFELAEYSQLRISESQTKEAVELLLALRQDLGV